MEIKVNIERNDYQQPTEIRQEVVQAICDTILNHYMEGEREIIIDHENPVLFIGVLKDKDNEETEIIKSWIGSDTSIVSSYDYIRIHGCEMDAAFKALDSAGYYIYGFYNSTRNESTYAFSKKPVYKHSDDHIWGFFDFID